MIPVTTRQGKRVALFGLGGSGMVTAEALVAGGAEVIAFDDNPQKVSDAADKGIPTGDLRELDFKTVDELVLSPGVPLTHPTPHWVVDLATAAKVPILGDVALFAAERNAVAPDSPFIAITGTNGKSTTTALVAHILEHAGKSVEMGGNIGKAVLSLEPPSEDRFHVVECSSYQIDLAPQINPSVGVLLNLAPDHLDRHGTMENYAQIKSRLVAGSDMAVIGVDDNHSRAIARQITSEGGNVTRVAVHEMLSPGVYALGEKIFLAEPDKDAVTVASLAGIMTLRGIHNAQNVCAAFAICHGVGLTDEDIQAGLETFPGLAHRMEVIGNAGKLLFVNDSKGTNADAAAMALSSFDNIYWIAGGLPKEGGIESLEHLFPRITKAYLVGEAAPEFAATLGGEVEYEIAGTLDVAVAHAAKDAAENETGGVILLSPACASFDQYANFELRGEAFRSEVHKIENLVLYGE